MNIISYGNLVEFYRVNLNKKQIISDLWIKKFDHAQSAWLNKFQIKETILFLEQLLNRENNMVDFLNGYLLSGNFRNINIILSQSLNFSDTRSLGEIKDFLKLSNLFLNFCDKDFQRLENIVLVKAEYFPDFYRDTLIKAYKNMPNDQITILIDQKIKQLKVQWLEYPYLCFTKLNSYYLFELPH